MLALNRHKNRLLSNGQASCSQFLVFSDVDKPTFQALSRDRSSLLRFSHHTSQDLLVVKLMPRVEHQATHQGFQSLLYEKLIGGMGLRACVMKAIGTTTFRSPNNPASSKDADAALKPATRTGAQDWPSFVIETGPSESLQRLRVDADWWLIKWKWGCADGSPYFVLGLRRNAFN